MKNKILLVGAGQIGSRYLQALSKYTDPLEIYVIDNNFNSIEIAKRRWEEELIENKKHKIYWNANINNNLIFDISIISTTAEFREKIISNIASKYKIKFWVIEKVLAQSLNDLDIIKNSIKDNNSAWVNIPRRCMEAYQDLKKKFLNKKISNIEVVGGMWGMGCNSIHFIDLVEWFTQQKVIDMDMSNVSHSWIKSKRLGFYEIIGEIKVLFINNIYLTLKSKLDEKNYLIKINFENGDYLVIDEMKQIIKNSKGFSSKFLFENQSDIFTKVAYKIINDNTCELTTLENSIRQHKIFLDKLNIHWNIANNRKDKKVPIT